MLRAALLIARKDLRLIMLGGSGLLQTLMLGLLLIFVFSLAQDTGDVVSPRMAATIFWLASTFCMVLAGNMCHDLESANSAKTGLLLAPVPMQSIWLGKALAIVAILFVAQLCFLPASVAFLRQQVYGAALPGLGGLLLIDVGLASLAALLGALVQGGTARESLLSVILFPLLVPALLAGISFGETALTPASSGIAAEWVGLALAFDAIFIAAGLVLFPFIYTDED